MSNYPPDMIINAMSAADMAQHIARMALILNIEIPSEPSGVAVFVSIMEGAATRGAQCSRAISAYQDAHLNLMRA